MLVESLKLDLQGPGQRQYLIILKKPNILPNIDPIHLISLLAEGEGDKTSDART